MSHDAEVIINEHPRLGRFDLERLNFGKVFLQILVFVAVSYALAMGFPQVKPLKVSSVYLHEQGHALVAWFTRGELEAIRIDPNDESGTTETKDGNFVSIQLGGYAFQCLVGAFALASCSRRRFAMRFCVTLGFITIGSIIAFLGKTPDTPTIQCGLMIVMGCVTTGFLCWSRPFWYLGSMVLRTVGTFWATYTVYDIYEDCFQHTGESDVHALAAHLGMVPWVWAVLFIGVGLISLVFAAHHSALPELKPIPIERRARIAVSSKI